jgi:hypothetical protein
MICGFCATGRHTECNGLCRATYAFCACWVREHQHPALVVKKSEPVTLRAVVQTGDE